MNTSIPLSEISSKYLSNELNYPDSKHYAAIIGGNPSKGQDLHFME